MYNNSNNKEEYILDNIKSIIDSYMDESSNFAFVVNYDLADEITDYLYSAYGIEDKENALYDNENEDVNEFLLIVSFDTKDNVKFYCSVAKAISGRWILCEDKEVNYYFGVDISDRDIIRYFHGDGDSTWTRFIYLGDAEIIDCDGDCDNCELNDEDCDDEDDSETIEIDEDDIPDSVKEEIRIIVEYVDKVNSTSCPHCVMEQLVDLAQRFKKIGYDDARDEMKWFLEENED